MSDRTKTQYISGVNTRFVGNEDILLREKWVPSINALQRATRLVAQATPDTAPTAAADANAIDVDNYSLLSIQLIGSTAPVAVATGCRMRIYAGDGTNCPGLFDTQTVVLDPTFPNPQGRTFAALDVGTEAEVVIVIDTITPALAEVTVNTTMQVD